MDSQKNNTLNIVVGGQAGQGLATIGEILAKSMVRSGYQIVVTQSYQSRIRGGHNTFAVRVSGDPIAAPQESIDVLIALDSNTVQQERDDLSPEGLIITDAETEVSDNTHPVIKVPFNELTSKKFFNSVALGVVTQILNLNRQVVGKTLHDMIEEGHSELVEENDSALKAGSEWCQKRVNNKKELPSVDGAPPHVMMNGTEAIATGAAAAGLKFFAFYPMTPATSIGVTLARWAEQLDLIVEQAEDEIAVINMALGASFAGAPSMVATSGGGFALMVEGVSLAAMTETPVVVVIAQRPAPATGLPTRTEQADLECVLHAGHGEFPRAIFAPGSIEQCFELTQRAFRNAERYHTPAFILSDQFLADSYRAVEHFNLKELSPVKPWDNGNRKVETPYRRYAVTNSGISPRLLPGFSEHLVVADSDEHAEDGHITEDFEVRKRMVEKRLKKGEGIFSETIRPHFEGDNDPETLMVCWGSALGAVREASQKLRSGGVHNSVLHFSQVWPLVGDHFIDYLNRAQKVVCVESNATGQFARLIRRETGFSIDNRVLRYDGLPLTPEYILRRLA